jgi:uncharacterized protein (TIGR02145 family)
MKYESIFNNNVNNTTMKTKHFLTLSLVLAIAISASQAQVRIGDLSAPRSGVSLDLNGNNNTATTGFGLPRVNLTDPQSPLPLANSFDNLNGVMVYNLTSGDNLVAGPYFASPNGWIRFLIGGDATDDADIVLLDPLPATVWLGKDGTETRQLTVTTTVDDAVSTLAYQWYYLDASAIPQSIPDSTNKTFTVSLGQNAFQLTSAGEVKKYFCVVRNGSKSVVTTRFRAVYGNGLFLNNDGWLNVLSYNLGVNDGGKSLTPAEQYAKSSSDLDVAGYLYQWGRAADGHHLRDTTQKSVAQFLYRDVLSAEKGVTVNSATGQVTASDITGRFILRDAGTFDWRDYDPAAVWSTSDPCSSVNVDSKTWRLPTSGEWTQIYANNSIENTGKGLRFKPDGTNTSVFLPAAGYRNPTTGALGNLGAYGYYWSSTPSSASALDLNFNATTVFPANNNTRSHGFSVRCVAD